MQLTVGVRYRRDGDGDGSRFRFDAPSGRLVDSLGTECICDFVYTAAAPDERVLWDQVTPVLDGVGAGRDG